jgi:hypothetical protein
MLNCSYTVDGKLICLEKFTDNEKSKENSNKIDIMKKLSIRTKKKAHTQFKKALKSL